MLTSLHPNSPMSDQAVRDLLDQRAARASHTRYTSVSYSQRSDSPSIYSRADYSPHPHPHLPGRQWPNSGYQMSLTRSSFDDDDDNDNDDDDAVTTFTRASFDQDDQSVFPAADDDISVIAALTPRLPMHPSPEPSAADGQDALSENPPTEEVEDGSRMSILGPKMRFVSRAPWELGGDDFLEEEEEEPSSATDALSVFSSKMSNWRSKDQEKASTKGPGLMTIRSGSPGSRPSSSKKGSNGMNSGSYRHQHQETQRGGPYGPDLSGASQSHGTILSTFGSSRSSHSVTDSLSSDCIAHKKSRARDSAASPVEPFPFPTHPFRPQNTSYSSRGESTASFRSESPQSSERYIHPYANPDLLPSVPSIPRPGTPISQDRISDEKERQSSPLRRASESATSSPPRGTGLRKASAGGSPLPAMPSRNVFGELRESDEISYPGSQPPQAQTTSRPVPSSPVRSMIPTRDQGGSPMHSLITLEQARARVHNTSNQAQGPSGINGAGATSTPSSTLVAGLGLAPGVVVDDSVIRGQIQRANSPAVPPSDHSSWQGIPEQKQILHSRSRTPSSGKHSSGAGADGDAIPAKTLKHKKSAFMKLFQGKDKEREKDQKESASSGLDYPVRAMSTPPQLHILSDSSVPPLPSSSVHNIKRVPPPLPLSVVVTSPSLPPSSSIPRPSQEQAYTTPVSPPRLRQDSAPLPWSSHALFTQGARLAAGESQPLSTPGPDLSRVATAAPPVHSTFETLSLRPVSTIFSAKFPDLLSQSPPPDTTSPTITKRLDRPDYPSPTTPGFSDSRSNSLSTSSDSPFTPTSGPMAVPPAVVANVGEEKSSIITSLQEQLINSRKMWQRQIWELEGQVKDLKAEVEELRNTGECETCGMAKRERRVRAPVQNGGVVDRPRPRLGGGNTRTVFGGGCDM